MKPTADYEERLLEALLEVSAFKDATTGLQNRGMLLRRLPPGPVAAISRFPSTMADLNSIVNAAAGMGQIVASGEWALAIVTRNALRFVRGTEQERALNGLLAEERQASPASSRPPEIVIGQDERLPLRFLEQGLRASRSVAKVLVTRLFNGIRQQGSGAKVSGTGWLIAQGLLLTNHHVIEARDHGYESPASESDFREQAANALAWFDYNEDDTEHWEYASAELIHANQKLDYALLRLAASPSRGELKPLSEWGFLRVVPTRLELSRGFRLNIIQHPLSGPKRLAIRSNFYVDRFSSPQEPERIRYLTDTEPGSSGSPVLNDD